MAKGVKNSTKTTVLLVTTYMVAKSEIHKYLIRLSLKQSNSIHNVMRIKINYSKRRILDLGQI